MRSFEPTELLLVCEEGGGQPAQGFLCAWAVPCLWERSAGVGLIPGMPEHLCANAGMYNHGMVGVGRDLKAHLVPPP